MSSVKEYQIKNYHEREIALDDGGESPLIPIRIRRFTVAQLQAFMPGFELMTAPPSERFVFRQPEGPEQEQDEKKQYRIPIGEIRRRRLAEMTPEQRAAVDAASRADQDAILEFCREVVAEHVWLPMGVRLRIAGETGDRIVEGVAGSVLDRPGEALAEALAGNLSTLMILTRAVADENLVGATAKKAWRSLSSSKPSSTADRPAPGARPAPIAAPAGNAGSARRGRASARRRPIPSGAAVT